MCKKKDLKLDPRKAAEEALARKLLMIQGRRRFLSNLASGTLGAAMALAGGKRSWYAYADAGAQKTFMINIHLQGGWDTNWLHMAFPKSFVSTAVDNINLITGMPAKQYDPAMPKPGDPGVVAGSDPYGRSVDANSSGSITGFYHGLYTERTRSSLLLTNPMYQSRTSNHFLGAGLVNAFANDTTLFKNRVCVLKGLYSGAAHSIPNRGIIHGSQSAYAIPYSGLISAALAQSQGKRPLHYMQLTGSPSEYGANWAMVKGDQVPINCPDHNSFKALISRSPNDFTDPTAYSNVNSSIARLGSEISMSKFALAQSKQVYSAFVNNFKSALTIADLNTKMSGFLAVWCEYAEYARQRLESLHSAAFISTLSPEVALPLKGQCWNTHFLAPYITGDTTREGTLMPGPAPVATDAMYDSSIASYYSVLGTPFTPDETSLNSGGGTFAGSADALRAYIATCAWKFAIAEYLITQGHSTIVDLTFGTGDMHGDNGDELRNLTMIMSLYAKMLTRLSSAPADPASPGGPTCLDRTLVTMFSEFDRTANLATDTSKDNRGTGHDITESILFAGFGVKPGCVVGDRNYGSSGGGVMLSANGTMVKADFNYVFPTIMKIFGVPIPAQQITDATFLSDVLA